MATARGQLLLMVLFLRGVVRGQSNGSRGLFPSVFNLATNAVITANATCGELGPEVYCKLVEHGFMREPQCGVCDASSNQEEHVHSITNAIDGTNRWWQSPSLQNGKRYEWVTITVDLGQVFQVAYVIVKAAIAPRPGNWILERSLNGVDYKPWQYYAVSDAECWDVYGVRPTVGKPRYRSDEEVICTAYYSKLHPLENGEIHTSLVNGRPGIDGPSRTLREFTASRYVRLRLQKIRTLNADLMMMKTNDPQKIDKSVTRRYFYAIKDISIGGQCVCFGHAKDCPLDPDAGVLRCRCEHNTCGDDCSRCCPGYNQRLWRAGTTMDGAECEKCQCFNHTQECYYDQDVDSRKVSLDHDGRYSGGGVCVNCKHHTMGINCEQCVEGYYRPLGVARDDPNPCRKCQCTGSGVTGICVKDDSYLLEGLLPGDCICKEGFMGSRCDHCAIGYKKYPACEPCPCHTAGTVGESTCEGQCVCKPNVAGARCEHCKHGHYNLDAANPEGCSPCFCSGVTNVCQPSRWGVEVINQMEGWKVSDLHGLHVVTPVHDQGSLRIPNEDMLGLERYFWVAPPRYLGKKLYSYGGDLKFVFSYLTTRRDTFRLHAESPGVILEGSNTRIGYNFGLRHKEGNITIMVPLHERGWSFLTAAGKPNRSVPREAFSQVINSLSRFLIRAKYHSEQTQGILYSVEMDSANKDSGSLKKMSSVEMCECPHGYAGLSCETCDPGFRRVNDTLVGGVCERCDCNNHAETCDPFTGLCLNCMHNATGPRCQLCQPGYFGNPLFGTEDDCRRCACPLENPDNNFSSSCEGITTASGQTDYICTACDDGYQGDKCERCADGYFGNPLVPGGYCQQCNCSGNEDSAFLGWCDQVTGQCLKCLGNTAGWNCHECLDGHYGSALHHECKPCECSPVGSVNPECDRNSGQCLCKPNFTGRNCDRCVDGYGSVELGCVQCQCNRTGSTSRLCDPVTGQCPCRPGVFGTKCDVCLDGYYSYSDEGCTWCGCHQHGAEGIHCEETTGQCTCRSHVVGVTCDRCEAGHWNLISGRGCQECQCNATGAISNLCDERYGQCTCKPGAGGKWCNKCLPGYYGFSGKGCRKCRPCKSPGHICDADTGDCACPPNTIGETCSSCKMASWGLDPLHGCKPCNCSPKGSPGDHCDLDTGSCLCLEGYEGRRCDQCRFGHYQFPVCRRCGCKHDGTEPSLCSPEGRCQCDDSGQCSCKTNTEGKDCDRCKEGTFGMTVENPKGCFECFCFGRSNTCEQSKTVWSQITTPSREVTLELGDTPLAVLHGLKLIPGQTGNVKLGIRYVLDRPLYWMLPKEFIGEKVLAYNGVLQFRVESHSISRFPDEMSQVYPLVLLQGNHRLVLIHTPYLPAVSGRYSVRMHEDEWKLHDNPQMPVTRAMLVVALQKVQHILIRATEGADVKIARLSDVSMEVAVPLSPTPASPYVAVGVESCTCPHQYTSRSCQDPAPGFYRKHVPDFLDSKDILDLVGYAEPCPCNNRSTDCDQETGICHNCTENTTGPYCNICAEGFYGDPLVSPCTLCACPLPDLSFSTTCEGDPFSDYVCTNCQLGYEGRHCERCSLGYYGNPLADGQCQPCDCNPYGSRDRGCDRTLGQCNCKKGITGRDCAQCSPRYILTEVGCKSCDDDCIGPLLDDVEFLQEMVENTNLTAFVPAPWIPLLTVDNETLPLKDQLTGLEAAIHHGLAILENFTLHFNLETRADILYLRSRDLKLKTPTAAFGALETGEDSEDLLKDINRIWKDIFDSVQDLQRHGADSSSVGMTVDKVLKVIEAVVTDIKGRSLTDTRELAERESRRTKHLLQRVREVTVNQEMYSDCRDNLDRLNQYFRDVLTALKVSVQRPVVDTLTSVQVGRAAQQYIQDASSLAVNLTLAINNTFLSAEDILDSARNQTTVSQMHIEDIAQLQRDLVNSTRDLEFHRGILFRLNPLYLQKYVTPSKLHANALMKQAMQLKHVFSATHKASEHPLKPMKVYEQIATALDSAEYAAREAFTSGQRAFYEASPEKSHALPPEFKEIEAHVSELITEAEQLKADISAMQEALREKKNILSEAKQHVTNGLETTETINKDLSGFPRDLGENFVKMEADHRQTLAKMETTHEKISDVVGNINYNLYPKLELQRLGSPTGLRNITETLQDAQRSIKAAMERAVGAEERTARVNSTRARVFQKIKDLRNNIILARQRASSIRVSLSANRAGRCVRSFLPEVDTTTTTNIVLNYAINTEARDSLLLLMASPTSEDFMIIEMVDRKIRFLWNAGGGTKVIQHNLTIETNDEQFIRNEHWYKIEVTRTGNVATLSVKPTPEGQDSDPYEVTDASPAGHSKMNLDSSSYFYIGGVPKGYRAPRELRARNFAGCLYEVIVDGKQVGLWSFISSQGCDACKEGATEDVDFKAYRFRAGGYAILPQIRHYGKHQYYISLGFKTFDENALLFFVPNGETGNFISLELRNGHVVFQFNLGNQSRSVLKTSGKYNTGNWTRLLALREKLQGQLSVDEEFLEGQLPPGGPTTLELQKSYLYFGGVPPNFTTSGWDGITFQSFSGCMKDIQVDTTPLNLLHSESYGVDFNCRNIPIKVVSFHGSGYLEVGSHPLPQEASFGFSFQTVQENAVLLLSTFEGIENGPRRGRNKKFQDYYSVSVVGGKLEARFGGGKGQASILSADYVNDGRYHTVTVVKIHRKIIMKIDDEDAGFSRLPKKAKEIDAPPDRGLFLGGLREGITIGTMLRTRNALTGTIKDIIFNNRLVTLNNPVDFEGAAIGRSQQEWWGTDGLYISLAQPLEKCAEMASYTLEMRALKFGDALNSHVVMSTGRRDFMHDFNVTFDFRTYYPNGLILLVSNGRRPSHFAVMLQRGHVVVDILDRKHRQVLSGGSLNSGSWHNVTVSKVGRKLWLAVDGNGWKMRVRRKLTVRNILYVGGVSEHMEDDSGLVLESFKGCIRNFHVSGEYVDLASGELHTVGPCFSTIEPGAYFGKDAYAVYDNDFDLGVKLDVQLEFKTTLLNGILLSLSEMKGAPSLALELHNGSVVVSVDLGDGSRPFRATQTFQSKYEMCDGRWHSITTQYDHKAVTLKVDTLDVAYGLSETISTEPKTSSPLYIGGLPVDSPTGALLQKANFVGCLRNIAINDNRVDWIDMAALQNVLPNSCPSF